MDSLSYDNDAALLRVSKEAFAEEAQCVKQLHAQAQYFSAKSARIDARTRQCIEAVRARKKIGGIEAFQQEYNLSSQEGIMLMCLAEALLRIPDAATADALIHDKLMSGDWDRHIGLGRPFLVNVGSWGLELADKVTDGGGLTQSAGEFIGGLIHRLGEPVVRGALKQAMKLMGSVFVLAGSMEVAKKKAAALHKKGWLFSFDMLGEGARSAAQAEEYFGKYLHAIETLSSQKASSLFARDGISIKLSALHPRLELRQYRTLEKVLMPKLKTLVRAAEKQQILLTIDAEESTRLDISLILFKALFTDPEFARYEGLGLAVQAYQKRAAYVIDYLAAIAKHTGKRIALRLVKGAYWDSEIKRAQADGLADYPVFTSKAHTDISYLACAAKLLKQPRYFYPQFATHNARSIASILEMAEDNEYEFQRLYGMGEALYEVVLAESKRPCRIYAPVGTPAHLLSYLIRRILENGANNSFVRGLYDAPIEILSADPLSSKQAATATLPLPQALYPDRKNSRGYDLGNCAELIALTKNIATAAQKPQKLQTATKADCDKAFIRAQEAFAAWNAIDRASCLERIAECYEKNADTLMALCVQEAGKTIADSIAEVREAIDYCRYYAEQARRILMPSVLHGPSGERNLLSLHPRGTIVAISPWNFPLAIFTGQIVAALVTGNCVIAKPAEQTPAIAALAVKLMHGAGVPQGALQLLCGSGEEIGQRLVKDERTDGVVFTGSTAAAFLINQVLAARKAAIAPLIAETGGQNCMIVDSSALIEQTVDDIILSAFGSAGQRCSALRVVFVQEEIADALLSVLAGAMEQLRIGSATDVSMDIGPVIDKEAYDNLLRHIKRLKKDAKLIAVTKLPRDASSTRLVAPHVFEIASIDVLEGEVFGPVLHVVRFKERALDKVIAQVNSTGYGLTFGIQSRIDEKIREITARIKAGNIYINRSMIGATVGVHPFGGMGLSGTGPKAGGPHYLQRFCVEKTVSVNTAAVGGNLELLVGRPD